MNPDNIQGLIHRMETGTGQKVIGGIVVLLLIIGLVVVYDVRAYHGFTAPDAMDGAQVARNLSEGRGYSTECLRPFDIYLVQQHNKGMHPDQLLATNGMDFARVNGPHPDLANPPVYPTVLAGLFKCYKMDWTAETVKSFWSIRGAFQRYQPEFFIAIFNQLLLCLVTVQIFFIARKLFDLPVAGLAAVMTMGSDLLWKFSVSGLSTMLLLVIFLALIWCLIKVEELARMPAAPAAKLFFYTISLGVVLGLGMLTRYSFGWLIIPVAIFLGWLGGVRRVPLVVTACAVFGLVVSPWIIRNIAVSGTPLGMPGYALIDQTSGFGGNILMQSLNPHFSISPIAIVKKILNNLGDLLKGDLLLAGGWAGVLFFAGLLLGLRSLAARRVRYFALASLGILLLVQAGGETNLSNVTPVINSENLIVLIVPLMNLFGAVFFLTLLDQMKVPTVTMRYCAIFAVAFLTCRALVWTVAAQVPPVNYPPYYPPEIQKFSAWMQPSELIMSDAPWAVAWYGDRQCVWTTLDAQDEYSNLDVYVKPVHALYLTPLTMDAKLLTEAMHSSEGSWTKLAFRMITGTHEASLAPGLYTAPFSLSVSAGNRLDGAGLFLTDHPRWIAEDATQRPGAGGQ